MPNEARREDESKRNATCVRAVSLVRRAKRPESKKIPSRKEEEGELKDTCGDLEDRRNSKRNNLMVGSKEKRRVEP